MSLWFSQCISQDKTMAEKAWMSCNCLKSDAGPEMHWDFKIHKTVFHSEIQTFRHENVSAYKKFKIDNMFFFQDQTCFNWTQEIMLYLNCVFWDLRLESIKMYWHLFIFGFWGIRFWSQQCLAMFSKLF